MVYCGKFSSGPTNKGEHWSFDSLKNAILGRSHRSKSCLQKIDYMQTLIREFLFIPNNFHVGFAPASATGAMEMALWNLIGPKDVNVISYDVFGKIWESDIKYQLKIKNTHTVDIDFGKSPDIEKLSKLNFSNDTVFISTATTTSVSLNDYSWIPNKREGLTFMDASASLFTEELDWDKFDVVIAPFQKVLGAEANLGIIILSPNAFARLNDYTPSWPIPRLLSLKNNEKIINGFFNNETINTPSMMLIEDNVRALEYYIQKGGVSYTNKICSDNYKVIETHLRKSKNFSFLCDDPKRRSIVNTCIILKNNNNWEMIYKIAEYLESYGIHDIVGHKLSTPSIRIWHGPTIKKDDIENILELLETAYEAILKY